MGQTGSGSTEDTVLLPVAVAGALSYRGLSAGRDHVCGLVLSGDVYCWGSNSTGQLGHMDLVASPIPQRVELQ